MKGLNLRGKPLSESRTFGIDMYTPNRTTHSHNNTRNENSHSTGREVNFYMSKFDIAS